MFLLIRLKSLRNGLLLSYFLISSPGLDLNWTEVVLSILTND